MLLLLAFLPSALNLPQSNPSQTLEYAPVPPEDDQISSPNGNLASFGLGSSSSIGGEADPGGLPELDPAAGGRAVKAPSTKRCVGNPPRQTEDPASPPCVASYSGDNGGATYQGVSGDEVKILFYVSGGFTRPSSRGSESSPQGVCYDLGKPADGEEDLQVRFSRTLQRYFNERYQTYGRFVRFIHCFDSLAQRTAEGRRSAAAEHLATFKPFAFINLTSGQAGGARDEYTEVMLRRGVLSFSSAAFQASSIFSKFPGLAWGYLPSIEQYSDQYTSFICKKVVGKPVSFSGNAGDQGKPRRFGLLRVGSDRYPELIAFAKAVRQKVTACGGEIVEEGTYPYAYSIDVGDDRVTAAQQNMVRFRDAGVTTVIWPGGWESDNTKAAAGIGYRPEWIMAGDTEIEGYDIAQFQEQSVWRHAWLVANQTREDSFDESLCYQALLDVDPEFPRQDAAYACPIRKPYESLRQLFTGIQVAGPRLHPETVDRGYHAIPPVRSDNPRVPACFYKPGDYTCVKDAAASWWDPDSTARNGTRGCWRMPLGGRRFLGTEWPEGDVLSLQNRASDVCNGFAASIFGG